MINSVISSCGGYLPEKILTNADLEKVVDTTDEWIISRTGIKQRHIVADNEFTSDMAAAATRIAMERAGLYPKDIDLIIVATTTPDKTFPSTATIVQDKLGVMQGFAFDIQAVCSGFVYALNIANSFIKSGSVKNAIIIGADSMSRLVDWSDRNTCVLFGDGAGAVVVQAREDELVNGKPRGILSSVAHSVGGHAELLQTTGGVCETQAAGFVTMAGREVFKHASERMAESVIESLTQAGLEVKDIDWLVAHQANIRILQMVAKKLGIADEKIVITIDEHANTSSASVPLALDKFVSEGKIKSGDIVVLEAFGAGFTWGSVVVRW